MMGHIEIVKTVYDTVNLYKNTMPIEDRQVLDPLTTMIKLALLGYKPLGTKLAIDKNRIYFQEPSALQGIWRWMYGNKRYELHHLLNPIIKAVKRFDISNPAIRRIFQGAVVGLDRLKTSYNNDSSLVNHSLDLYMSIINNVIMPDQAHRENIFHSVSEEEESARQVSIFKNLWADEEINLVSKMIEQIETAKKDSKTYLDAVNTILVMKEDRANELLNELAKRL